MIQLDNKLVAGRDRPDFTCFQAASETAAITRDVAAELGPLANTQGKPEVGPFAQPQTLILSREILNLAPG